MASAITVLLVDDHAALRAGYRRLLEGDGDIRVVGEAADAAQACEFAEKLAPDVVVMDIALPGASGIEAMRRILARQPQLRVLVVSMHDEAVFASRALQAGAWGFVAKIGAPERLVQAIRSVAKGEPYLSAEVAP